jgi:hypothetical protein
MTQCLRGAITGYITPTFPNRATSCRIPDSKDATQVDGKGLGTLQPNKDRLNPPIPQRGAHIGHGICKWPRSQEKSG